jgi:tRNA threonylcarbamoyladenosine modification (KEOPS) complex  Pcc1 subunit
VIEAHWMAFFNPKTSAASRISLLQDGEQFAAEIRAQDSSSLAEHASARVTSVTLVSATRAKVVYTLLEDGTPARANQLGVAVYQDGTWKVGVATFRSLLAMENGGRTSSLPTACQADE